jgi:hypothetical protein
MFSDLHLIARGAAPGRIARWQPIHPRRPRRGDWHHLDPMPPEHTRPSGWVWLLIALLALGMAATAPHQPGLVALPAPSL